MLSTNYRNALNGLKAQGKKSHLFEGCEAEAAHIYRIIMIEQIMVNDLDELRLETLLKQEVAGKADYSKRVNNDGLQYVDLEKVLNTLEGS